MSQFLNNVFLKHIAIIMDGNGRWAQKRNLPRLIGHQAGVKNGVRIIEACHARSVKVVTLFVFSSENWKRPEPEVSGLLKLFQEAFDEEIKTMLALNIRVRVIGDVSQFSVRLQETIRETEERTQSNTGLTLVVAVGYGGQWDIVQAARECAHQVLQGSLRIEEITPEKFSHWLQLSDLPSPDLCIRTGGEYRMSNFLLWHLAYSEFYFTPILWPDFNECALDQAIHAYASRDRRFGTLHETTA